MLAPRSFSRCLEFVGGDEAKRCVRVVFIVLGISSAATMVELIGGFIPSVHGRRSGCTVICGCDGVCEGDLNMMGILGLRGDGPRWRSGRAAAQETVDSKCTLRVSWSHGCWPLSRSLMREGEIIGGKHQIWSLSRYNRFRMIPFTQRNLAVNV